MSERRSPSSPLALREDSNHLLVSIGDGQVTFRYKDYSDAHRQKTMSLQAEEFLRRFTRHILPRGFVKARHYGLLANRHREDRLNQCRSLLLAATIAVLTNVAAAKEAATPLEPLRVRCCPQCAP